MDEPTRFVTAPELVPNSLYDKIAVPPQADRAGHQRPAHRPGHGRPGREVHHPRAGTPRSRTSASTTAPASTSSSRSPGPCWCWPRPTTRSTTSTVSTSPSASSFPRRPPRRNGIEDARFVRFIARRRPHLYYATYTAYDGQVILPQLLETEDFLHFKVSTLNGPRGAEQGHGPVPPPDQRPVRHALAAGRREPLPDVLGHARTSGTSQGADRPADLSLGVRPARQLRLADRDRGRLAGADPRRRPDAQVLRSARSCSTSTTPAA